MTFSAPTGATGGDGRRHGEEGERHAPSSSSWPRQRKSRSIVPDDVFGTHRRDGVFRRPSAGLSLKGHRAPAIYKSTLRVALKHDRGARSTFWCPSARGPSGGPMERIREHRTTDPRQRPHSLFGNAGAVPRLFVPRNVWIGTLGTAQNAVIFTTGPSKILPGQLVRLLRGSAPLGQPQVTQ